MTNLTHLTDLFQSGWNLAGARKAPPAFVSTHGLAVRWLVLVYALQACCTAVCHAEPTAAATADPADASASCVFNSVCHTPNVRIESESDAVNAPPS